MKKNLLFISAFSFLFSAWEKKSPKKDPASPTVSAVPSVSLTRIPNFAETSDASSQKNEIFPDPAITAQELFRLSAPSAPIFSNYYENRLHLLSHRCDLRRFVAAHL
jgi:hypothetical protein